MGRKPEATSAHPAECCPVGKPEPTNRGNTRQPELLAWDSEFWGVNFARAYAPDVDAWSLEHEIDVVCLLVDADDPRQAQLAESKGFRLMDVRVTLARAAEAAPTSLRTGRADDVDRLARIAGSAHGITRFYADPRLPDARCDALYETWLRKSCAGWADIVLVAERDGTPSGFVTVDVDEKTASASIGLIAVAADSRGAGLGTDLVRGALAHAHARDAQVVTVVTQGRNVAAQRLFQRCGFVTRSTELWFHRWFERPKPPTR